MALIRRRRPETAPEPEPQPLLVEEDAPRTRKKDAPTPSRRDAERARMERLHPVLTPKEQKAADRQASNDRRMAQQNAVEASPERALIRNIVDSGWHIGEFIMPAMLLVLAVTFLASAYPQLILGVTIAMWAMFALVLLDIFLTWRKVKRILRERLHTTDFRTLFTYTMNRVIQIRRFRNPPPVIKRGESY